MSLSMPLSDSRLAASDVLSPELALVDEQLAVHARGMLTLPRDTLGRIESTTPFVRVVGYGDVPVGGAVAPPHRAARLRSPRRFILAWAILSVFAFGTVLQAAESDQIRTMPDATDRIVPPTSAASPSHAPTAPTTKPSRAQGQRDAGVTRTPSAHTQRFAWAPVPGASGYHMELFARTTLVFATDTVEPHMLLPARWTHDGKSRRLVPGSYRWLVWAKVNGVRQSQAIVQAELAFPSR